MSKEISVIVPDNYNAENVILRIKNHFDNDPKIVVVSKGTVEKQFGEILKIVLNFQQKLKEVTR